MARAIGERMGSAGSERKKEMAEMAEMAGWRSKR